MPPWLLILIVMAAVILGINPTRKDFAWFQALRRPRWVPFAGLLPLVWMGIYACFYVSALLSWEINASWNLVAAYVGLLVLVEGYTWLMCRTRRLGSGTMVCLLGWCYALWLFWLLQPVSAEASLLLLPYLLWSPLEALITWQMRHLNQKRL